MTDYVATCLFDCGKLTKHGSDLTGCDEGMPVVVRLEGRVVILVNLALGPVSAILNNFNGGGGFRSFLVMS